MIKKCLRSFGFAANGIRLVFLNENNAKVHLLASLIVVAAGVYFRIEKSEWCWIILSISLVWILEIINSAIEKLVDLVSLEFNLKAAAIKDMAAGAVLVGAIFSLITGVIIFLPYVMN